MRYWYPTLLIAFVVFALCMLAQWVSLWLILKWWAVLFGWTLVVLIGAEERIAWCSWLVALIMWPIMVLGWAGVWYRHGWARMLDNVESDWRAVKSGRML